MGIKSSLEKWRGKMENEVLKRHFKFSLKWRITHSRASITSFLTVFLATRIPYLRKLSDSRTNSLNEDIITELLPEKGKRLF